jgi:hypothetical protein
MRDLRLLWVAALVGAAWLGCAGAAAAAAPSCADLARYGADRQTNLRAASLLVACGHVAGGSARPGAAGASLQQQPPASSAFGSADINLITGAEVFPHVTQSESFVSAHAGTVVVNYNDSRDAPNNFSGVSVSTDGGATFRRLLPSPFATGHGTNFGDPIVAFNARLGRWFAGDLATGCGGGGIGLWESASPAAGWTPGACAHDGFFDDRESMWVDNNPASPHYGRMYISWNDFAVGGTLLVTTSDDGRTWRAPVTLAPPFTRNVQLTGSADAAGTVYLAAMDEGGGGFNTRQNIVFRSRDGGVTWSATPTGPRFPAAGDRLCDNPYFAAIQPIWRHMGWGQPAAGPGGVVAYNYAAHGAGADPGDVFLVRSTDGGATFGAPLRLNTDSSGRAQWMPSLVATASGAMLATWYDRRNTTDGLNYERFGRVSTDNGATWGPDMAISDVLIPQPQQPDFFIQACYAGDYNYITAEGDTGYDAWTDGRVAIQGVAQQDVFLDEVALPVLPTTKQECMSGGWRRFGRFTNQGDCVSFVVTGGRNPPGPKKPKP